MDSPSQPRSKSRRNLLPLGAGLLIAVAFSLSCLAQDELPPIPSSAAEPFRIQPDSLLNSSPPEIPQLPDQSLIQTIEPAPSASLNPGYWLVNTWNCTQSSFDESPCVFRPEIIRCDSGGHARRHHPREFQSSFLPGVPVVIVVHGSFMDDSSVHPYAACTWRWLCAGSSGLPFQMIYFSWPSDRPPSLLTAIDVAVLGRRASRNGFYLLSLLQMIPPECPVCLLGHSHGTRVISSALHLMAGGTVEGLRHNCRGTNGRRIRTIFTASAIDHDWLLPGERFDRALYSTECLINLRNHLDPALVIYVLRRIGSGRALGCSGLTSADRRGLGSLNQRVRELDVSGLVGPRHLWPKYCDHPQLARTLRNYLYFADTIVLTGSNSSPESAGAEIQYR